MTFFNTKHGTRTRGRVPADLGLKQKQAARIIRDLCPKGCCMGVVDYAQDLEGNRYFKDGLRLVPIRKE